MTSSAVKINEMLNNLNEEDCTAAISYIEFLSARRKERKNKSDQAVLKEIQGMFENDKGWGSEEEMLEDMAEFREKLEMKWPDKAERVYTLFHKMSFCFCKSTDQMLGQLRDLKDIPVLSDALYHGADLILTGDKDFLDAGLKNPLVYSLAILSEIAALFWFINAVVSKDWMFNTYWIVFCSARGSICQR